MFGTQCPPTHPHDCTTEPYPPHCQCQMLDGGAAAIATALGSSLITDLSLAFTGAADRTCVAFGASLRGGCALRHLNLCGNGDGLQGVEALSGALEAGARLETLNLSANGRMGPASCCALARALPRSSLRRLYLAGCGVDRRACGQLAAALPSTVLERLDLSANHFGDMGAWDLAWALPDCSRLEGLDLSDCDICDDGADELLDALSAAPRLTYLDMRGNKTSSEHELARDPRVNLLFQRAAAVAA